MRRFIITVLDSVGCGALPDAAGYQSIGANTLLHVAEACPLQLPHLQQLGLGNILPLPNLAATHTPAAAYGKMAERSAGMDTTTGHWEIAGLVLEAPLPTYPDGFPAEVIEPFSAAIGRGVLGNCVASGTKIINDLGVLHLQTGKPIVYTSADSVFQIAAHEEICPPQQLYDYCQVARQILQGKHGVGRVIARPFIGNAEEGFQRTTNRRDFSLQPPPGGLTEAVAAANLPVVSIGKIYDIFAGAGITDSLPGHTNEEACQSLLTALQTFQSGLLFANLVDFDMLYGHRNDVAGYAGALEQFDRFLPALLAALGEEDILVICADHGNDPASAKTDHDREYVPLLVYGQAVQPQNLGVRESFADLGQTAAEYLRAPALPAGKSFLTTLLENK